MTFSDIKTSSHAIASFVVNLKDVDIPGNVRFRGTHHLLDSTGVALASATFYFAQRTMKAIRGFTRAGAVPVLGTPVSLSSRDVAMMNDFLIHGLDFDGTHIAGVTHPSASAFRNSRMTLIRFEEAAGQGSQTLDLAKRITYQTDLNSPFPETDSGKLIVTLKDSTELRHSEHISLGADERPLTNSEVVKKYNPTTAVAVPKDRAATIRDTILALDSNTPLTKLLRQLEPSAAANLAIA